MPEVTQPALIRLLFLAGTLLLVGCRNARPTELPGKYAITTDWGQSTLTLRPDHTMEQEVSKKNGSTTHIAGSWKFSNGFLSLQPCLEVRRNIEGAEVGGCASGVDVTLFGKLEISVDSDHGLAYENVQDH